MQSPPAKLSEFSKTTESLESKLLELKSIAMDDNTFLQLLANCDIPLLKSSKNARYATEEEVAEDIARWDNFIADNNI
jgi:hypothetical protein